MLFDFGVLAHWCLFRWNLRAMLASLRAYSLGLCWLDLSWVNYLCCLTVALIFVGVCLLMAALTFCWFVLSTSAGFLIVAYYKYRFTGWF